MKEFSDELSEVLGDYDFSPAIGQAIKFFLTNPDWGMAIVDRNGIFQYMDRESEKLFDLPKGGAKGIKASDLYKGSLFPKVLKTRIPLTKRIFTLNNERYLGSTYPLFRDDELVGAIGFLMVRSLDELEPINKQVQNLKKQVQSLRQRVKQQHSALYTFDNILGDSKNIRECLGLAQKAAMTKTDVLIVGESGTGKELFAQAIHNFSHPDRPFVAVNSPAIPFDLAESELFGYRKGAFSGAVTGGKPGKFELANRGTLLLDEVSTLPLSIQAKLLRVLEEREIQALGATRTKKVDFHLICATNEDPKLLIGEGKFRTDLYYRMAKILIQIEPLRNRKEDIPILVDHFLEAINRRLNTGFKGVSEEVLECFMGYEWVGNVREVINVLEQACLKKWEGTEITLECLPPDIAKSASRPTFQKTMDIKQKKLAMEKELILHALEETKGNKRRAALLLNMPHTTFYKKLNDFNIKK